jgi:hypothetical protein
LEVSNSNGHTLSYSGHSPVALWVPLHHARAAADRKPAGGLIRNRGPQGGTGQGALVWRI